MKKLVVSAVALLIVGTTVSNAAEQAVGVLTGIDSRTGEIHLQTGEVFSYEDFTPFLGFVPGDKVAVGYRTLGSGEMVALGMTRILPPSDGNKPSFTGGSDPIPQ